MADLNTLPDNLPIPLDDGAASHLLGMRLPDLELRAIDGSYVNLSHTKGRVVIYCYPMTGRSDIALPEGWDQIPGARGCTPQSCAFRGHYQELRAYNASVFGLSTQSTEYQQEMAERLHLPFLVLSDEGHAFSNALQLPTFAVSNLKLLKRLTFIAVDSVIKAVHYPVYPSDKDPEWVMQKLRKL